MEDVAIIFVLTMVTINICGMVYIGSKFLKLICKAVHYTNLMDKEEE